MGFQQGLSGLNISSRALDAVGNNIANSQTVGFKTSTAIFADVYANALVGGAPIGQVGAGGAITTIAQAFTQGNVTASNNPLDIAINGNGFLRFQPSLSDATASYSRNGQLFMDKDGYIVNAQNMYLNAYPSTDGITIDQTETVPIQIDASQLPPRVTGFNNTLQGGTGGVQVGLNLDVRDKRADMGGIPPNDGAGWESLEAWNWTDPSGINPNMYNYSTSVSIFDQKGESHVLTMYFRRIGLDDGSGEGIGGTSWDVHVVLDNLYEIPMQNQLSGERSDPTGAALPTTGMQFTAAGQLDQTTANSLWVLDLENAVDSAGNTINLTTFPNDLFPPTSTFGGATDNYDLTLDFDNATMFGSGFDVSKLTQDGYAPGRISGIAIDKDGMITARYSNGQTKVQGQIVLSTFTNPNGLQPLGNNMWAETSASGQPLAGVPNSGARGAVQSGAVEESNVDLTAELVDMIVLQRAYQANAQTIRTQDQILNTLVNLR